MTPSGRCTTPRTTVAGDARFEGRTIVITGAGGQFGAEGCLYFARRGARIAALDVNGKGLEATFHLVQEQVGPDKFDFEGYTADICDVEAVNKVADQVVDRFKRVDLLWNNAGYQGAIQPLLHYDPQDFKRTIEINVAGSFIVLQTFAKRMISTKAFEPAIVNTASVAGLRGTPAMPAYAASKAGVLALNSSAAKDLAPFNIRVNAISPALIGPGTMWDRQNELHAACPSPYFADDATVVAQNKINSVPLKRLGTVQEVVQGVAFLLSADASYMTGANLQVDGGMASGLKA